MHRQIEWPTLRRGPLEEYELRIGGLEFLETGWVRSGYPGEWGTDSENEVVFWSDYFTYHWFMDFIRDEFQVDILWKFVKELKRFSFFSEPRNNHQLAQCLARAALNGDMRVLSFERDLYGRIDWNDPNRDYTPMVGIFLPVKPKEPEPEPPIRKVEDPYGRIRIRVVEDSTGKPIPSVKISFFLDDLPSIYTNGEGIAETANVLGRTYVAECQLGELLSQAQVLDYVGEGETPICPSEESPESDNATEEFSDPSSPPPKFIIAHVKGDKRIKWEMTDVHINEMRTVRVRRVNLSRENANKKRLAYDKIDKFAKRTGPGAFKQISRSDVAKTLRMRVADPSKIDQGASSLCGPASLVFSFANSEPDQFADYVINLYENGQARLGKIDVIPGTDLKNYRCASDSATDWIATASLRDSENWFFDYQSTDNEFAGITMPHELTCWFENIGFTEVINETNIYFDNDEDNFRKAGLLYEEDYWVCLFVNANLLYNDETMFQHSTTPDHWIVLTSPISIDSNDRVKFKVFTWGEGHRAVPPGEATIAIKDVLENYYGFVAARR